MNNELVKASVVVRGDVQGVFFRHETMRMADQLGVAGWVRNASDGTVEAVFEGPPAAVNSIIEWCKTGPPMASVEAVDVSWQEPLAEQGFRVR